MILFVTEVAAEIAIACINKETDTTKKVSDEDDNDDEGKYCKYYRRQ